MTAKASRAAVTARDQPTSEPKSLSTFLEVLADRRSALERAAAERRPDPEFEQMGQFVEHLSDVRSMAPEGVDNVWTVAGLSRNEVRTTAVLGWLLDARQGHGFGDAILSSLLDRLAKSTKRSEFDVMRLGSRYTVNREFSALGGRDNRVDLAIEGENCLIFIEVKIDAPPRENQLKRYLDVAQQRAKAAGGKVPLVLYLCERPGPLPSSIIALRWRDIADAIRAVLPRFVERLFTARLLEQLASHIENLH